MSRRWWGWVLVLVVALAGAPASAAPPDPGRSDAGVRNRPVDDPYRPIGARPYLDVLRYRLHLKWDPRTRDFSGRAVIDLRVTRPRTSVVLDLASWLVVDSARVAGRRVAVTRLRDRVRVPTGPLDRGTHRRVVLRYHGPLRSDTLAIDGPEPLTLGVVTDRAGNVGTGSQPWGSYTWFPVNDRPYDKAGYDVTITARGGLVGVSNGRLVERRSWGGTTRTRFRPGAPLSSYAAQFAVGDYTSQTLRGPHGLPIVVWSRPGAQPEKRYLRRAPSLLRWVERRLGRYPFGQAGVVLTPLVTGMEHQSAISMGEGGWPSREVFLATLVHEFVHEWAGNRTTPTTWPDLFLSEGIATYLEGVWKARRGITPMRASVRQWRAADTWVRDRYGTTGFCGPWKGRRICGLSGPYTTGALLMHALHRRYGADFDAALRAWPRTHPGGVDRAAFVDYVSRRLAPEAGELVEARLALGS